MNPNNQNFTEVSEYGEFRLIRHLTEKFPIKLDSSIKGPGDDSAVIQYPQNLQTLISTDMLLEGVHFDLVFTPLKHLGYKSIVVAISDIFAMNAFPQQVLVSFAVSKKFSVEMIDEVFEGIKAACDAYNVDLIGGDTSSSLTGLTLSITAMGGAMPSQIVYRNGAKENDLICCTGDLGAAYMGLQILEREKKIFMENPEVQPDLSGNDYILERQLRPEAQIKLIETLREKSVVPTAMMDISDGLASELLHICGQSECGCKIYEEKLPIDQETYNRGIDLGIDPTTAALNGGEDYEIVFTVSPDDYEKVKSVSELSIIGHITEKRAGHKLITRSENEHDLTAQGWNAFS